jgi:HAMP domain-containing protein
MCTRPCTWRVTRPRRLVVDSKLAKPPADAATGVLPIATEFIAAADAVVAAATGDAATVDVALTKVETTLSALTDAVDHVTELIQTEARAAVASSAAATATARTVLLIVLAIGAAGLAVARLAITRAIRRPVGAIAEALAAVAGRELTATVTVETNDEIRAMSTSLGTDSGRCAPRWRRSTATSTHWPRRQRG